MSGLPAWWLALAAEARAGLALGTGPWWSGRFLCGQPLFGAPELPFGGPASAGLLAMGAAGPAFWLFLHAVLLSSGLALWLRQDGEALGLSHRAAAWAAFLAVAAGLLHPEAAALLGVWAWLPWVLLLAGRASVMVAAPFCALLACAASPLTLLLGLLGSGRLAGWSRSWGRAWGLGLLMASPALLETLRLLPGTGSVAFPHWQFGWLGSPLLLFQAGLAGFTFFLLRAGWLRGKEDLALMLTAGALAVGGPLFSPASAKAMPPHMYVTSLSRHQAAQGALPGTLEALAAERWTGAVGGLAPRASLSRWGLLSSLGLRDPDDLSLANVGWLDNDSPQVWHGPVAAAVVDGAEARSVVDPPDQSLFQHALRLDTVNPGPGHGQAWHLFTPKELAPGWWQQDFAGTAVGAGAWGYLSESSDAGWQAWTMGPGEPAQRSIAVSQGGFLAAALQGGETGLEWRYEPPRAWLGILGALLGFLAWTGALSVRHGLFAR